LAIFAHVKRGSLMISSQLTVQNALLNAQNVQEMASIAFLVWATEIFLKIAHAKMVHMMIIRTRSVRRVYPNVKHASINMVALNASQIELILRVVVVPRVFTIMIKNSHVRNALRPVNCAIKMAV
jgi:hypothetical protein